MMTLHLADLIGNWSMEILPVKVYKALMPRSCPVSACLQSNLRFWFLDVFKILNLTLAIYTSIYIHQIWLYPKHHSF